MGDQSGTDRATAKLTEGPIVQTLVGLAGPMVIGLFSVMAFNLTDTYFVSQLGTLELAAMSFTFPVVSVLFGVTMGLSTGTVSVVSRAIGRGEMDRVKRVSSDSLLLAFIVVLVLAGVGVLTIDPLFRAMGAARGCSAAHQGVHDHLVPRDRLPRRADGGERVDSGSGRHPGCLPSS